MGRSSLTGLLGAVSLLTRVPTKALLRNRLDPGQAVPWFPIVSAVIGALVAVTFAALSALLPVFLAAVLAVGASYVLTGAFHEDGLGDFFDAIGGGWTAEKRLEILDDPRLGTFGVLAVVIALLARVGSIAALDPWSVAALLPAAGAVSQVGGVVLMRRLPAAKPEGLAAAYTAGTTRAHAGRAIASAALVAVLLIGAWGIAAFAVCGLIALIIGAVAKAKINGITGDVLGATQQIAEVAILLLGVVVVHNGWGALAWWTP